MAVGAFAGFVAFRRTGYDRNLSVDATGGRPEASTSTAINSGSAGRRNRDRRCALERAAGNPRFRQLYDLNR